MSFILIKLFYGVLRSVVRTLTHRKRANGNEGGIFPQNMKGLQCLYFLQIAARGIYKNIAVKRLVSGRYHYSVSYRMHFGL